MNHGRQESRPRVSVLGAGAMGRLHARVFAELGSDFELVGVYDPNAAAARSVADAWSVQAFEDESAALAAADLVVVASPIEAHAGAARRAMARGCHLLVEKPVCATAAQAFALARGLGRGQRLFVGHSERFNPVVRALHQLVPPGDVRTIRLRRTASSGRGPDHGALVSLGVHDLDLVAHLTDSPVALRQVLHLDHDRAHLVLGAARGAVAWIEVDRGAPQRERTIELVTKNAVYSGDLLAKTLFVQADGRDSKTPCTVARDEALVAQASAIARALRGSREAAATGVEGARALALVEQANLHRPEARAAAPDS